MTAALALLMTGVGYSHAEAQVRMRDLVFTVGGSVEDYSGNLSAVTVPLVDSTDHAWSAVGEMAVRGQLSFFENANRSMELSFDGGVRQAAAMGFEFRDYSPREWVGTSELRFSQSLGTWGSLGLEGAFRSRSIRDRTPMPLFLQPGYAIGSGAVSLVTRAFEGVSFDVKGQVEEADYTAATFLPQLDLLDRRGAGVEAGARWGSAPANLRVYGGVWWSEYEHQSSFVPEDPFRRDRTVRAGLDWSYFGSAFVQIGVEGTVNRSNSNRPEYDAPWPISSWCGPCRRIWTARFGWRGPVRRRISGASTIDASASRWSSTTDRWATSGLKALRASPSAPRPRDPVPIVR
jgi:hypothetical protein